MRFNWFSILILLLVAKSLMSMNPMDLFCGVVVVFTCLPLHEFAHGYVAYKLGDPTAENEGRLTLNPFAHLDLVGTLMILFLGFGWAKPVPVNPRFFKNPRAGMALTALAGPVSNLILAFLCMVGLRFTYYPYLLNGSGAAHSVFIMLQTLVLINISLALFNLLPIYPLDGSRILSYFLPAKAVYWVESHEQLISLVMMAVVFLTDLISYPLSWLSQKVFFFMLDITDFIDPLARALMIRG